MEYKTTIDRISGWATFEKTEGELTFHIFPPRLLGLPNERVNIENPADSSMDSGRSHWRQPLT